MAVYERIYRGYRGELAPAWSRFRVMARYALEDVFRSRLFLGFFVACFVWPLVCATTIYLHYNFEALALLQVPVSDLIKIDGWFFQAFFLRPQLGLAFVMVLITGPALISPDLRNNALPLYLSRPLNRTDYVLGKLAVLAVLMSVITWVPGLLLFVLEGYLAGNGWLAANTRIGYAIFVGSWAWILVLSLMGLAVSAWVKWKPWARVFFLGLIFVASAMGHIFRDVLGDWRGSMLILFDAQHVILSQLFGLSSGLEMPAWAGWVTFTTLALLSTILLFRRIKAFEVVR
jgi:ABC-2 type transport system permease protein